MESRELRYFLMVAEEGSFTRAAARLFITQPALSRAVRQLERDLGTTLFTRTHRGATLTPAGRVLLRVGREALDQLDRAATLTRAAGSTVWGPRPLRSPAATSHAALGPGTIRGRGA